METVLLIGLAALLLVALALAVALWNRGRTDAGAADAHGLALQIESLKSDQRELMGRLAQLAEAHQSAQASLNKTLGERLDAVSKRMGDSLTQTATQTASSLGELRKHLSVIDQAQKNITELTGRVVSLQDILANKQARGAFGEVQLGDIVRNALPPSAYEFQAVLSNGRRADCLIRLPKPPGPIAIDAKFPLESYHALREAADETARAAAGRAFAQAILKHVGDIAERYIVPGETAESALMFLPSEAVYAELHASFGEVVERSYRARVWIVSPTTLMATLNTVRAVLKDVRMREQAGVIQREVLNLLEDVRRLDERMGKLQRHFSQAEDDMRQVRISTEKVVKKGERIGELQFEDPAEAPGAAELTGSTPRLVAE